MLNLRIINAALARTDLITMHAATSVSSLVNTATTAPTNVIAPYGALELNYHGHSYYVAPLRAELLRHHPLWQASSLSIADAPSSLLLALFELTISELLATLSAEFGEDITISRYVTLAELNIKLSRDDASTHANPNVSPETNPGVSLATAANPGTSLGTNPGTSLENQGLYFTVTLPASATTLATALSGDKQHLDIALYYPTPAAAEVLLNSITNLPLQPNHLLSQVMVPVYVILDELELSLNELKTLRVGDALVLPHFTNNDNFTLRAGNYISTVKYSDNAPLTATSSSTTSAVDASASNASAVDASANNTSTVDASEVDTSATRATTPAPAPAATTTTSQIATAPGLDDTPATAGIDNEALNAMAGNADSASKNTARDSLTREDAASNPLAAGNQLAKGKQELASQQVPSGVTWSLLEPWVTQAALDIPHSNHLNSNAPSLEVGANAANAGVGVIAGTGAGIVAGPSAGVTTDAGAGLTASPEAPEAVADATGAAITMGQIPLPLSCVLTKRDLNFKEILALQPGDLIPLGCASLSQVEIMIKEQVIATARVMALDENYVVQIQELLVDLTQA